MNDESMERLFENLPAVPRDLAASVHSNIIDTVQPAKPLPSTTAYAAIFALVAVGIAAVFAFVLGLSGLKANPPLLLAGCGLLLLLFGGWMVLILARAMRPGSGRMPVWSAVLSACVCYQILAYCALSDYSMRHFVPEGFVCFLCGSGCALCTAGALWLLVRKGMIVQPVRAGAALGAAGGLAGLFALTLHCPNQTVPHLVLWHAAVPVFGLLAGALLGMLWANPRATHT